MTDVGQNENCRGRLEIAGAHRRIKDEAAAPSAFFMGQPDMRILHAYDAFSGRSSSINHLLTHFWSMNIF
jgi:hypothetical protein